MKNRLLSILCMLSLCVGMLPSVIVTDSAAADFGVPVRVGDQELIGTLEEPAYALTDENGAVSLDGADENNYQVKWDGQILTLNGATVRHVGESGIEMPYSNHALVVELAAGTDNTVIGVPLENSNPFSETICGITTNGNLAFSGTGSLVAQGEHGFYASSITIESGNISAVGVDEGIACYDIVIQGGTVHAKGAVGLINWGMNTLIAGGTVTFEGSEAAVIIQSPDYATFCIEPLEGIQVTAYTGENEESAALLAEVTHPNSFKVEGLTEQGPKYFHSSSTQVETTRQVVVGGVKLNGSPEWDQIEYAVTDASGSVTKEGASEGSYNIRWDGETLTLKGATVKNQSGPSIKRIGDLNILLAENTENSSASENGNGIYTTGSLTVSGSGTVTASGNGDYACGISSDAFTIQSGTVAASGNGYAAYGIYSDVVEILDGTVSATMTSDYAYGIFGRLITISGGKLETNGIRVDKNGELNISGGTVDIHSNQSNCAIYSGGNANTTLTISGGTVTSIGSRDMTAYQVLPPEGQMISVKIGASEEELKVFFLCTEQTQLPGYNHQYFRSALVPMDGDEPRARVITPPAPAENLIYSGEMKDLVTPGEAENGTVMYRIEKETGREYKEEIPSAMISGTYTIWYYARGDEGYLDSVPVKLEVTIDKYVQETTSIYVSSPETIYDTTDISSITLKLANPFFGTITLDPGQTLEVGTHPYTFTLIPNDLENYESVSGTIDLTVEKDTIQSIAVTTPPDKIDYAYGDVPDLTGMKVTATYASGNTVDVTDSVTVLPQILTIDAKELAISYNGVSTTQTITVSPKELTSPAIELAGGSSFEFTGNAITPAVTVRDGDTLIPADEYSVSYSNNTQVGTATVTITDNEGGNYTVSGSATFEITKAKATVTTPPSAAENLTYTGQPQPLVTAGTAQGGTLVYSTEENGNYSASVPTGTNAGEYTVWYKVEGDENHSDSAPVAVSVTIDPISVSDAQVSLETREFEYSGSEQTPGVTVQLGEKTLRETDDYTLDYAGSTTHAGTVTITITGRGNYSGSITDTYTIVPAELSVDSVTLAQKTYDGTTAASVKTLRLSGIVPGETLEEGTDYTVSAAYDGADAGEDKTATVTVTLKTADYTFADGEGTATCKLEHQTITKADFNGLKEAEGFVLANYASKVDLPAIPAGSSYGEPHYTGSDLSDLRISGNTLFYTGGSSVREGKTYTVDVPVNGGPNYNDCTIKVTLHGTDKLTVDITGVQAANGLVYNGQPQAGYTGAPVAQSYSGTFTVTYNTADGEAPTDAGDYTVTFAVPDSDPLYTGRLTVPFSIGKKPLTVSAPDLTVRAGNNAPPLELVYTGLVTDEHVSPSQAPAFTITKSDGTVIALADAVKSADTYTITWNNAGSTSFTGSDNYEVTLDNTGTLTVTARSTDHSSSSGSNDKTETEQKPDGSTITTVTKPDGSSTETTKYPDGSQQVVNTDKDGTVTTTTTDTEGNKTEVEKNPDGSSQTTVTNKDGSSSATTVESSGQAASSVKLPASVVSSAAEKGETVTLPMPEVSATTSRESAPTVKVDLPSGTTAKVEIPVANVTPGTVAVIVKNDGSEEVIKTSLTTDNGVAVTLSDGDTVKIVDNSRDFADVSAGYWATEAVDFVSSRELFAGTSTATFSPDTAMSRAMIVTVLARYDSSAASGEIGYEQGRQWAMEAGISDGSNMDRNLTREQLATMLWRYAGSPDAGDTLTGYTDTAGVSSYARQAMAWAVAEGIITGTTDTTLTPQGMATRAQVATMLMRFIESNAK